MSRRRRPRREISTVAATPVQPGAQSWGMRAWAASRSDEWMVPLAVFVGSRIAVFLVAILFDRVIFLHSVPEGDLPGLYSGATLCVFPSEYEGFGLPVLEAMACGTPVVCSNAGSLPEVVGDAALLVPPDDTEALATAICEVLEDEVLRAEMRARGLAQAQHFTWEEAARQTVAIYEQVLCESA